MALASTTAHGQRQTSDSAREAVDGKRVALVIGNSQYKNTAPLGNPRNDAADMARALGSLGFEVIEGHDLEKASMDRTIRDFANALNGARVGLFFYAGHGLQVMGQNYLVPTDAQLTTSAALDFETVRLDLVHRTMEREAATNIIILDACRDNPLARNLARALGTRSTQVGRGLAAVESGEGTLISYSTQPGNVALDGAGRNSPFAEALLKHIAAPGDDLPSILINVRNDVMKATARRQVPWEHSAMTARFYFTPPQVQAPAGPTPEQQIEILFWGSVKDSTNPTVIGSYIDKYPNGEFVALARALRAQREKQAEAERKRQEEVRQAAEVSRIENENRKEQARLAEERARAQASVGSAEAQRLADEHRRAEEKRAGELRKAEEEARLAREAARVANEQRLAALKVAEEAKQAAEAARAAKEVEQKRSAEPTRVAVVPKTEKPKPAEQAEARWTVRWTRGANCKSGGGGGSYTKVIKISPDGTARWSQGAATDGAPIQFSGRFSGSTGSGTFARQDGQCSGTFTARRG
jgi:hypothetical protein